MNEVEGLLSEDRVYNEGGVRRRESVEEELDLEDESYQEDEAIGLVVYLTFALIGGSYLWPWNCFLSATPYFFSRLEGHQGLMDNVPSCIMFINTFTSFFYSGYLTSKQKNANYRSRVIVGELVIGISFLGLALLCVISVGPVIYFISLMAVVFFSSAGAALTQTGSFSLVSKRGSRYTQAIMVGQAMSGVLPSSLSILSGGKTRDGAPSSILTGLYFLSATTISSITIVLFIMWLEKVGKLGEVDGKSTPPEIESLATYQDEGYGYDRYSESAAPTTSTSSATTNVVPMRVLFAKLFIPSISVALTFAVTLIYPIFAASVISRHGIATSVFVPLAIFSWNVGDLSGRILCAQQKFVVVRRDIMISYALFRLLYIPAFLFCHGGTISSDIIYLLLQYSFGVTNGHLASSAMMSPNHYVDKNELEAAGGFMTVSLIGGLTIGSIFSFAVVMMIH